MHLQACRHPAAPGQSVPRPQAPSLDIGGERARDLQKRRKCRVAIDVENELPGISWHQRRRPFYPRPEQTGLGKISHVAIGTWTSMQYLSPMPPDPGTRQIRGACPLDCPD